MSKYLKKQIQAAQSEEDRLTKELLNVPLAAEQMPRAQSILFEDSSDDWKKEEFWNEVQNRLFDYDWRSESAQQREERQKVQALVSRIRNIRGYRFRLECKKLDYEADRKYATYSWILWAAWIPMISALLYFGFNFNWLVSILTAALVSLFGNWLVRCIWKLDRVMKTLLFFETARRERENQFKSSWDYTLLETRVWIEERFEEL